MNINASFLALGLVSLVASGCTTIDSTTKDGLKATTVSSAPILGPANTITIVERSGKSDIIYASDDRSLLGIIAPAAIGAVGGVIVANNSNCTANCGGTLNVASAGAVSETATDVVLKVNSR